MAELGSAFVRVVPDTTALNAQMGAYFTSSRWKGMGKAAGIALGAGLAAGGAVKGLYEIGEAFDDAYDKIRVATGKSGKDLGKLKRSFKDVVSDVPTDFDSASTAISGLSQRLGLTGKPLERLSKQMLELSRITDTDLGENVQSVTRLFGDWSIKTRDQTKTLDKLFRLSQASGIQVATLAELMTQFGSPLRQLGIDFDTAAAMFSRFEREGVNIQTLMPGLRFALKTLSGATPEVTAELKKLGIATGDPAKGLQQVFEKIEDAGSAAKANQLAFQVFGVRAGPDMAAAIREGRFELDDLIRAMDDGSDTIRKAGRETMDFGEQLTLLKNNVFVALEPVARRVFGAIGDEARRLRKILTDKDLTGAEKFQAVLEELGRIAHKYGPKIAEAGGRLGLAIIKGIWDAFWHSDLLGKLFIGGAALKLFGGTDALKSLGRLAGKRMGSGMAGGIAVGMVIGTALLAPEAYKLGKKLGAQMKKPLRDFFKWMVDTFGGVADKVLGLFSSLIGSVADVYDKLAGIPVIGEAFKPIADGLHDVEDSINGVRDAMRDIREFRKNPLGFTREALRQNAGDVGAVTDKLVAMGISYKRAIKLATQAGDEVGPSLRRNQQALDLLGSRLGATGDKWGGYGRDLGRSLDRGNKDTDKHRDKVKAGMDRIREQLGQSADKAGDYEHDLGKSFGKTTGSSARMAKGVGRNVSSLANGVAAGLDAIKDNLNKSLAAFSVKKVSYSIKKVGNAVGNVVDGFQHGGPVKSALVPGTGSGDKVPLHIGGQLAAMVEPNELVSVTNRTATAALMAHNRRVPRRAQGGMVDPAGPGTGLVNEAIAGIVGRWSQRFNAAINYGYDPGGGHLSPGHNVTGTATDTGPAGGWGAGPTRLFEQGLKLLLGSGLTVLYGSHGIGTPYPNHGYGNHAHIEWGMHPVIKGLGAAAAETIKRILLKGPKGPLRDMGQSALDKTRKAASAYLAKHSGGMMGGDIGAPIRSLPEALQKYNRTYAEHNSAEGDWGGYRMPFNAVAALAEWAGAPGVSMARTAIGESNLRPGATGVDPGGTKGYGLWMITTSFNDDLVKPYGGYGQMLNPVLNAQVMNKILDRQGIGAWYSSTKDTSGTHYSGPLLRKHGGLVPHLAKGGKAGDKDLHGTATPGPVTNAFKRFRKARRIAKQLKDLLGERGRVARVDERIANAEALAGLASSEAGSEMGPKELARQIRLNELLLANLVKARKLARSGLGLTRWPKGMSVDKRTEGLMKGLAGGFRSNLVDLTGLTGAGGRIFETKNIIDELKHTTGAGPAALDISGLRSVIEAARYGVFDGYFARGGNLKPGRWGIAGERGPEVVHGPSTVLSPRATQDVLAPKVEVHNEFDFDGLDLYVTTKVNGEIAKRERVNHRRGRQAVR